LRIPVYSVHSAREYPALALGMILAYAREHRGGELASSFELIPPFASKSRVTADFFGSTPERAVVLCSDYLWSTESNLALSRALKKIAPGTVVVHGGPSVPKYEEACETFMAAHPWVDIAVRGEGEVTTAEILRCLAAGDGELDRCRDDLATIDGITFRSAGVGGALVRTADRKRVEDLDMLPSPYLAGIFSDEEASGWLSAVIETNRGCPYGCTFCDWGSAILQKVRCFSLDRVRQELDWIAHHGIDILWGADANFGIYERDLEIAEHIASLRQRHGAPRQLVVNYAKNATDRLADIIRVLNAADVAANGIVSIQTRDETTLAHIHRSNIRSERYDDLVRIFRSEKLPASTDLMIGLPGATPASFREDLQFFFDRRVPCKAYRTQVLPNAPMAHPDYLAEHAIEVDDECYIVATSSFTRADLDEMLSLHRLYHATISLSLLKYFLYWLQLDHGIPALDFLDGLRSSRLGADPAAGLAALLERLRRPAEHDHLAAWLGRRDASLWSDFYAAIAEHCRARHGIDEDSAMSTILEVQLALVPRLGYRPPPRLDLQHDVVAYFEAMHRLDALPRNGSDLARLESYPPGSLQLSDPLGLCEGVMTDHMQYDAHSLRWELDSPLLFEHAATHLTALPAARSSGAA
jgi:hypothetical protein